ncbi:MAG TPA: magnesium transporter [Firmicutes bacterium]|nr:magnesium transporter [Bacillota bacterium]
MPKELLKQLLNENPGELYTLFADAMPVDLADAMASLTDEELLALLPHISSAMLGVVVQEFDEAQANRLFSLISTERALEIINAMSGDDAADLLNWLEDDLGERILTALPTDSPLHDLLSYEEESSGSIMTTEFLTVRPDWTVDKALQIIRAEAAQAETIYYTYVTDRKGRLVGVLSLRELVLAQPTAPISSIMRSNPVQVTDDEDQEQVAALFRRYDLMALPVVDENGVLKGIVTGDDIIDVVDDEATEDIQRMAAMQPSDTPYLTTSILKLAGQRFGWLLILMVSATFTGQIMRHYEELLAQVVFLAVFIPMLMDTGGNAGSQSSTLVIRGLALGEIRIKDWWKVMGRELAVSSLVGIGLAAVNFGRILLIEKYPASVALVVSLTLVVTIMLAKMVGGLLPILAQLVNIDPAIMAGPLITTIVDALALIAYFNIAGTLLNLS